MSPSTSVFSLLFFGLFGLFGYGPVQDHSEFINVRLTEDNRAALFSLHKFAYQPATGWRAFPDGGIPRYVEDVNIVGIYDLQSHSVKLLRREKNSQWQPGSGSYSIHAVSGSKALLVQGGQLRGPFKLATKYFLMDINSGKSQEADLKSDLEKHGRDPGVVYLVDNEGTLVFITSALGPPKNDGGSNSPVVPEIWVRTPSGVYLKAATSAHYERTKAGEVIYWEPATRSFMAFSISTGKTYSLPGYKVPSYEDITRGAILSSDRRALLVGEKIAGSWQYRPLDLKPEMVK